MEELRARLSGRGTESEESLQKRLAKAEFELTHEVYFDRTIINSNLEEARNETFQLISDFIEK